MIKTNKQLKILVTGSAGFIGSHLYDALFAMGYEVYGIDDLSGGYMRNVSQKKYFTMLDLRNREKTAKYVKKIKPDIVFHLAADATEGRSQFTPFSAIDRNLVAYTNLLIPAIKNGLKKVILISSMSVYGKQQVPFNEKMIPQPEDVYGVSKMAMEKITQVLSEVYGFKYVIVRPHNVYGPRQNLSDPYRNVIGIFINRLLQGKNFYLYGDGSQERAFSYIGDIVLPMTKIAFKKECEGKIFNLGSDNPITLVKLAQTVLEEFFGENEILAKFKPKKLPDRPQEVKFAYCSHKEVEKILNFKPNTNLRSGIKEMIKWSKLIGPQQFTYLTKLDLENEKVPETWKKKLI